MKRYLYFILGLFMLELAFQSAVAQNVNLPIVTYGNKQYYQYEVQPKETIYGLSRQFGISEAELIAMNPFLSDGMKIGQKLIIPVKKEANNEPVYYSVEERKESLTDIANKHDVSIDSIRSLNPNIPDKLKRGSKVLISMPEDTISTVYVDSTQNDTLAIRPTIKLSSQPNVALLLPLMLNDTSNIPTERYIEFYEGILMAADTLRDLGISMNIRVFDVGNTLYSLQKTLSDSSLIDIDFLIAGVNQAQMPFLSEWSKEHQKTLVLPFSSRIPETENNPYIYQVNPPHHFSQQRILRMDTAVFSNKNVLLIRTTNEELDERVQLFKSLKTKMNDMKIPYQEVPEYDAEFYQDTLTKYISLRQENLIIPAPFSLTESNRIISLVGAIANANRSAKISIWGYPEWIALSKNNLPQLHALNAYIYGNYYADFQKENTRSFQLKYGRIYGKDLLNTFPRYAMMGYDILIYFSGLFTGNDFGIEPLQHSMDFVRSSETSGYYNQYVYLIHYLPNRKIAATPLPF